MLNILVAYPYYTDAIQDEIIETCKNHDTRLLLDSGAFTAWKSGKPIMLDQYCRFIESLKIIPWRYFALDVVGDPEKSLSNYNIMLKRGFNPVPIFTRGENPSIIDELYKTTDLVAIGGLVGTKKNKGFVKGILPYFKGRNVHLLGFTNKAMVKVIKPYSCDSSANHGPAIFGHIDLFNRKNGEWMRCSREDFLSKPSTSVMDLIRTYDIEPKDLSLKKNWISCVGLASQLGYQSFTRASMSYEKKLGVKYFNVFNNQWHLKKMRIAYEKEMSML